MILPLRPTWLEIDLGAIRRNARRLIEIANTPLMAVVKANAYGHGAIAVARAAMEAGASWLGVAAVSEAIELRQAGLSAPILVLGYTPPRAALVAHEHNISLAVFELGTARASAPARVHVKVDTGMGRLGLRPAEVPDFLRALNDLPGIVIEGLYTHFASADLADPEPTRRQGIVFSELVTALSAMGLRPPFVHAANSPGLLAFPDARFDLVRSGIALYGLHPSDDVLAPADFQPALAWKAELAQARVFPPGTGISYGHEYVTAREERLGVVPVGYADGFRRTPKNVNRVLAGGREVKVVGRVCMDQVVVNLDDVPGAKIGDEVVIIGRQGEAVITAEDVARRWGTINYDVVAGIMARVPRVFLP